MSVELTPKQPPYYEIENGGAPPQQIVQPITSYVNVNNSGSNPQTISTILIPANTIRNAGDSLQWDLYLEFITGVGAKTATTRINSLDVFSLSATAAFATVWERFAGFYNGSNQINLAGWVRSANSNIASIAWNLHAFNPTIDNNLHIVITSGIANDIKVQGQWAVINKK